MFNIGDLVQINNNCTLKYFAGKIAIVVNNLGQDHTMTNESGYNYDFGTDEGSEPSCYYSLLFSNGNQQVFSHKELMLRSKAERIKNENR